MPPLSLGSVKSNKLFNDKGEFIRPRRRSSPPAPPTSSDAQSFGHEDLIIIAKGLGALALLASMIWLVVTLWEWIMIGLMLWVFYKVRRAIQ